jgi:hypothetical protein
VSKDFPRYGSSPESTIIVSESEFIATTWDAKSLKDIAAKRNY